MFHLSSKHYCVIQRLAVGFPSIYAHYSHRLEQKGLSLSHLSIPHNGEELVGPAVARGQTTMAGCLRGEAKTHLSEKPSSAFRTCKVYKRNVSVVTPREVATCLNWLVSSRNKLRVQGREPCGFANGFQMIPAVKPFLSGASTGVAGRKIRLVTAIPSRPSYE